jgi:hypothetical protein
MILVAAAWSAEPESLEDLWRSVDDLQVLEHLVRRVEAPIVFGDGPLLLHLDQGWLVPIFSGRAASEWDSRAVRRSEDRVPPPELRGVLDLVGFGFVGTGSLELRLYDRAEPLAFANRQVLDLGRTAAEMAAVAHGGPYREAFDRGLFLSIDPALEQLYLGKDGGDPYDVIVYEDDAGARQAIGDVRASLAARTTLYDDAGLPVGDWIGLDRLAEARGAGVPAGLRRVYDVRGADRQGVVVDPRSPSPGDSDRWLGLFRDDTGALDPRRRSEILSVGRAPTGDAVAGFVGGEPFPFLDPRDPTSPPVAPVRMKPVFASSRVFARPSADGLTLAVTVQQRLQLTATGGAVPWFALNFYSVEAVADSFGVDRVTLADGTPVADPDSLRPRKPVKEEEEEEPPKPPEPGEHDDPAEPPPFDDLQDEPGSAITVFPPSPVPAGATLDLVVEWHDTWPWANRVDCGLPTNAGVGAGLTWYLPSPQASFTGAPWKFRTLVAVPAESKIAVSSSGVTTREWKEDGWRWTDATGPNRPVRWAGLMLGQFSTLDAASELGYPAIRANLFSGRKDELEAVAPYVRQILHYYGDFLPALRLPEYDVAQQPSACGGFVWVAPYGMAAVQTMMIPDTAASGADPWLAEEVLAHEVAHQYFGQVLAPPHTDDMWASESLSESFACMYAGAAFAPKVCDRELTAARKQWEAPSAPRRAALSEAYRRGDRGDLVYRYGPVVLLELLRPRIGSAAYFAALSDLASDGDARPTTTERLEAAFSKASGEDLGPFFDYWIYGGYLPEVDLTWTPGPDGVGLDVRSDVPFGTFDVPVRLTWEDGRVDTAWVVVVDGHGTAEVASPSAISRVDLDPDRQTVARARRVHRESR